MPVESLLDELCVGLGICLSPAARTAFAGAAPTDVDAFTDAVLRAEGLDPALYRSLRAQVRTRVARRLPGDRTD